MLGYVGENIVTGKVRQFFWHDVESLPRDGSVTLLDVRTLTETARGGIDGFVNIPLDSLRERLHELPKDKPVYVHCHSGLRSYIACRASLPATAIRAITLPAAGGCTNPSSMNAPSPNTSVRSAYKWQNHTCVFSGTGAVCFSMAAVPAAAMACAAVFAADRPSPW